MDEVVSQTGSSTPELERRQRPRTSGESRLTALVQLILEDARLAAEQLVTELRAGAAPAAISTELDRAMDVCRQRRISREYMVEDIRRRLFLLGYPV
jgi:hypothetical protein